MEMAEHSGDDFPVDAARVSRGLVLINQGGSPRAAGFALLAQYREAHLRRVCERRSADCRHRDPKEKARTGDSTAPSSWHARSSTTRSTRATCSRLEKPPGSWWNHYYSAVRAPTSRGAGRDRPVAAEPTDPGFVLFEVPLLRMRALLAQAHSDAETYAQYRDRYRDIAKTLGFEGHIALATAMP